ncbi:MAG: hypothetical protein JNK60_10195, partial [Acidobacteria bacterium]|nr:hypothetical protein [Acidobacteriota bacterium]
VSCFLKDRTGFVWIGTDRGLNRFDGHDFRWFLRDDSGRGLPDSSIQALLEDQKGNIWIGTANGGLTVFDPVSETFRTFRNEPEDPQSLAHDRVYALHQGRSGRLYVGTKGGLSELELADGLPARPRFRNTRAGTAPGDLTNDRVSSVLEDSAGTLWVGTKKGLHRRRPGAASWEVFRQDPQNPVAINDEEVYSLLQDDGGDLWIGTWGGGGLSSLPRSELSSASPRFRRFDFPLDDPRSPGGSIILDIVQDSAGDLWFGSTDGGLGRLLREERASETPRFLHYRPDLLDPSSLQSPSAGALLDDGNGTLWIAEGQNGIALWDRATERIALYRHRPAEPTLLPKPPVAAVLEDAAGRIWVGTGSGLTRITPRAGPFDPPAVKHFHADPAGKDPAALASENVYALLEDRRSRIWVGTVRGGLAMLEPGSDRFVTFRGKRGAESQLQNDTVLSLLEDAAGAIWVGTYEGLYRLDEGNGHPSRFRFQAFHHEAGNPRSLSNDSVETLFQDKAGRIWIGTYAGLNVLRPGETAVERVIPKERALAMLGTGFVHGLLEAPDGTLWIGTGDGGLVQYDPATGGGRALAETAGLASRLVLGVARDARGRLWFPTPSGLHRYDEAASRITVFGRADGLQSDVGSRGAWHAGRSGRLYFGGPGGLSVFSPADLAAEAAPPNVVLTEFLLANRPVSVSPGGRLEQQVAALPLLTLSPKETVFALSFSALVPRNPNRVRYAYRMEGFDEDWIETDWKNRRATYTNLPPGSYRFRVVAARVFSPLSEEGGASLAIRVLPPWYRTLWFRLLLALATIGTPVLVLLARNRRLERSRQELEREVAARTHDLASANVRLEKQARELALVQEKLARILDSAPQAASDVEGWAVAMAGEVRRALGALELGVFALRGGAFEALSSDGIDIPPPDLSNVEATASGEIPLVAPNQ